MFTSIHLNPGFKLPFIIFTIQLEDYNNNCMIKIHTEF